MRVRNPNFENLILVFGKSKSPKYEKALTIADKMKNVSYTEDKRGNIIEVCIPITLTNIELCARIMGLIYRLKSPKLISNGRTVPGRVGGFSCFLHGKKYDDFDNYCAGRLDRCYSYSPTASNLFGCIKLPSNSPAEGWFTFGKFSERDHFVIDKARLETMIKDRSFFCPIYDERLALSRLDSLPGVIDMNTDEDWSLGETVAYNEDFPTIGPIPLEIKNKTFGGAGYLDSSKVEESLEKIKSIIANEETTSRNLDLKTREVYLQVFSYPNCCSQCQKVTGKIFKAKDILQEWEDHRTIPVPVFGCDDPNYGCRCSWNRWLQDIEYIKNGEVAYAIDETTKEERQEWLDANPQLRKIGL